MDEPLADVGIAEAVVDMEVWSISLKAGQVPVRERPFNKLKTASLSE